MLNELIIRNFAIIERLHVSFRPGFNVLTGETGAGKSIIIDAVGLLLGDRARPDLIRTGEEEASVEAVFDISELVEVRQALEEAGFEADDELLVRRVVSHNGKNRIYLNGSLAKLGQLQQVTSQLVVINGQHEHQKLQRTESHLTFLDQFAGLQGQVDDYAQLYHRCQDLDEELQQLLAAERDRQRRLDLLTFQSEEIAAAQLQAGEEETLTAERQLLQHAERLALSSQGGFEILYGAEDAVCGRLDKIADDLLNSARFDPSLAPLAETVRSAFYSLEDVATQLRDYSEGNNHDPQRIQAVEDRLALLTNLKRKYGPSVAAILAYAEQISGEIDQLQNFEASRQRLEDELAATREKLLAVGQGLSSQRQQAAERLQQAVLGQLADLAMEKARFAMRFFPLAEPGSRGLERGEFYLSPNPGEELKPLAWIASGGELSRIMLALKRAAPDSDKVATVIFDEVDAGIGGMAATAVGEKLRDVSKGAQVLCITHLPQVAACGDHHYRVEKQEEEGRTRTRLVLLEGEERVAEMARMLGGAKITERTLEHARELVGGN